MGETHSTGIARREFLIGAGATGLGVALTSCGGGTTGAGGGGGGAGATPVTLILDVAPYGKHSPFFVAKDKGFWSERGLDVRFQHGQGSSDTVTKVGAGAGEFGFADTSAAIQGRGNQNNPTKLVCMFHYKNLMSAQGLESSGINEPKDLVGKNLVTTPGDGNLVLLPALAEINGFDREKVRITLTEHSALVSSVVAGQADGSLDYFTGYPAMQAAAKEAGEGTTYFLYADHGLDVYNNGILVRDEYLTSSPDQVRAFTAGFVDGVVYTVSHPDEAVQIFMDNVPGITADVARAQQQVAINHLHVPEVEQNGFGPMSEEKMRGTLDIVNEYFDLDNPVTDTSAVFTNDYVPQGEVPAFRYDEPREPEV